MKRVYAKEKNSVDISNWTLPALEEMGDDLFAVLKKYVERGIKEVLECAVEMGIEGFVIRPDPLRLEFGLPLADECEGPIFDIDIREEVTNSLKYWWEDDERAGIAKAVAKELRDIADSVEDMK